MFVFQGDRSLAGWVTQVALGGFRLTDIGVDALDRLWERGGLPRSFLAGTDVDSLAWARRLHCHVLGARLGQAGCPDPGDYDAALLDHDRALSRSGLNGAELARALGVSQPTVRRYLDALTDALVVRQLQPWFVNTGKREVKSPKVYVRDTGVLHRLLRIGDRRDLLGHPKVGASWEGFVIEQILMLDVRDPWFWGTHAGAEIGLLVTVDGRRVGVEVKRTDQPRLTPSVRNALHELDRVIVVHAGQQRFPLAPNVEAIPAVQLLTTGITAGS